MKKVLLIFSLLINCIQLPASAAVQAKPNKNLVLTAGFIGLAYTGFSIWAYRKFEEHISDSQERLSPQRTIKKMAKEKNDQRLRDLAHCDKLFQQISTNHQTQLSPLENRAELIKEIGTKWQSACDLPGAQTSLVFAQVERHSYKCPSGFQSDSCPSAIAGRKMEKLSAPEGPLFRDHCGDLARDINQSLALIKAKRKSIEMVQIAHQQSADREEKEHAELKKDLRALKMRAFGSGILSLATFGYYFWAK